MAITVSNLDSRASSPGTSSIATNSISPTSGAIVIVSVASLKSGGTPNVPTVSGLSVTWTQVDTRNSGADVTVTLFKGTANGNSGTLTIDFGGQSQTDVNYSIDQFVGASGVIQHATATATSLAPSVTLSALQNANSVAYGFVLIRNSSNTLTKGSNFTQLTNNTGDVISGAEYAVNQTVVNWTFSPNTVIWVEAALEMGAIASQTGGAFLLNFV